MRLSDFMRRCAVQAHGCRPLTELEREAKRKHAPTDPGLDEAKYKRCRIVGDKSFQNHLRGIPIRRPGRRLTRVKVSRPA